MTTSKTKPKPFGKEVEKEMDTSKKKDILYWSEKKKLLLDLKAPTAIKEFGKVVGHENDGITLLFDNHLYKLKADDPQYDLTKQLIESSFPFENDEVRRHDTAVPDVSREAHALETLSSWDETAIKQLLTSEELNKVGLTHRASKAQLIMGYIKLGKHNEEVLNTFN